ncbi:MAG: arylsulfatase [Akkermansiaceae bacterium]|nr:arylsulfatase [Akkermansiaceae bacterium]
MPIPALAAGRLAVLLLLPTPLLASLTWTGGGDGVSVFQEANWVDTDTGSAPPAGTVDGGQPVPLFPGGIIMAEAAGTYGPYAPNFDLGGNTLHLSGGGTLQASAGYGLRSNSGGGNSSVFLSGTTALQVQFLLDIVLTLSDASTLTLSGGGNPVNSSTINLTSSFTGEIRFTAESVAAVQSEHLSKITVDGAAVVLGTNAELVSDGGAGSILTAAGDLDGDGMLDIWEIRFFGDTGRDGTLDFDTDGLDDLAEFTNGTDPTEPDSDGDGLDDGPEVAGGTNPNDRDTDNDGLEDGVETDTGTFLSATDTGTDPLDPNTDGDRVKDGGEVRRGTDPTDPADYPELPNVIFIMADDLGIGEVGAYGSTKILTPHIDSLAAGGMKFTNFYSPSAVCAPTRGQLLTGKHAGQALIRNNGEVGNGYQRPLPAGTFTLGTLMQNAGYATSCIGKWGLGGPATTGHPNLQGFDHFFGYLGQVQAHHYYPSYQWRNMAKAYYSPTLAAAEGGVLEIPGAANETGFNNLALSLANKNNNGNVHSHDAQSREALDWITAHAGEAFFMYLAYPIPHVSVQPPGHIDDLTDGDGIVFDNAVRTAVEEFYPGQPFGAPISHPGSGHYSATPDKRHEYAAMITAMDRDIGRIRSLLQSLGLENDTLLIFCSDNGVTFVGEVDAAYFGSTAGLRGAKGNLYEGGIRSPFIASWPGKIPAGSTSGILGHFDDLMPTLGELTATPHPPDVTGRSILPTLLGEPAECQEPRDYLYFEFSTGANWTRAVRQGDWKLHRSVNKTTGAASYELYNLASDPAEASNVHGANPGVAAALERIMDGDHSPSELFFRPTDEFAATNGVTVSYGTLGLRLNGTGEGISPLLEDITGKVTFKLTIDPSGGPAANGAFLFGAGSNPANLVKVEADPDAGLFRLTSGGDSASAALTGAGPYDLEIVWEPALATVTLASGATSLPLTLGSPPAVIDHVGYSVTNAQCDFTPVTVCLEVPAAPVTLAPERKGPAWRLRYERPAAAAGAYICEQSESLATWSTAALYTQARTRFGGVQEVVVQAPHPAGHPDGPPKRFYRVRYQP